ncbi:hypothetical protein niasHT_026327 [Heterodera trifolii]|uniref:Uncharacterized protein n=1 Tax=Heterodera trifolii TaxID=157864 RepID=A0ABD2K0E0_9BILA
MGYRAFPSLLSHQIEGALRGAQLSPFQMFDDVLKGICVMGNQWCNSEGKDCVVCEFVYDPSENCKPMTKCSCKYCCEKKYRKYCPQGCEFGAEEIEDYVKSCRGALNRTIKTREKAPYAEGVRESFLKMSDSIWDIYTLLDKVNLESDKTESAWRELERAKNYGHASKLEQRAMTSLIEATRLHLEARRVHTKILDLENKIQSIVWELLELKE